MSFWTIFSGNKMEKYNEKTPKWPPFWNFGSHLENFKTLICEFFMCKCWLESFFNFWTRKNKETVSNYVLVACPPNSNWYFTHVHVNEWDFHEFCLVFHVFGSKCKKIQHLSSKLDKFGIKIKVILSILHSSLFQTVQRLLCLPKCCKKGGNSKACL